MSNSLLNSFDESKLEQLVKLVLEDWADLNDRKLAYKFPGIAAEILSTPNQRVIDFFSAKKADLPIGHLLPFIDFFVEAQKNGPAKYLYTRSGYVCKILNGLVLHRTGAIVSHLMTQMDLTPLIDACHCRSASMTVLNLITLLASSIQTPMMMAAPASLLEKQNEAVVSTIAPEVVQETLTFRKDLFKQVLVKAIATAESENHVELHANLVWIISQLLIKQSAEKPHFIKLFNSFLPEIVDEFVRTFTNPVNNRLGNLFLVALESQSKDTLANSSLQSESKTTSFCLPDLPSHIAQLAKALVDAAREGKTVFKDSRMTHTFSSEMGRLNPKVYKVLEALNVSLRLYSSDSSFLTLIAKDSNIHQHIFTFFSTNPFNNILHNLTKKYLLLIIEKAPGDIVDLYFASNPAFIAFIDQISSSPFVPSTSTRKVKQGYIGQVVSVCAVLKDHVTPLSPKFLESKIIRFQLA